MSVGLEDTEDLIEDLDQALKNAVGEKNCQVSCVGCSSYMFTWVITTKQERIKGTEKAPPIHTLFHR